MRIVGWSLLAAALVLVIVGLVTGQLRHHADYGVFGFILVVAGTSALRRARRSKRPGGTRAP